MAVSGPMVDSSLDFKPGGMTIGTGGAVLSKSDRGRLEAGKKMSARGFNGTASHRTGAGTGKHWLGGGRRT